LDPLAGVLVFMFFLSGQAVRALALTGIRRFKHRLASKEQCGGQIPEQGVGFACPGAGAML